MVSLEKERLELLSDIHKYSYQTFQEARIRFIEILENVVFINRYYVDEGIGAEYSSPLWDKIDDD